MPVPARVRTATISPSVSRRRTSSTEHFRITATSLVIRYGFLFLLCVMRCAPRHLPRRRRVFAVDMIDENNAGEGEGTRIIKWPPDPNRAGPDNGNDFAYFRLGEILLIKAEALNDLYPGSGEALALLNALRARVFEPDKPLTTVDRDAIFRARRLQLPAAAKRRQGPNPT